MTTITANKLVLVWLTVLSCCSVTVHSFAPLPTSKTTANTRLFLADNAALPALNPAETAVLLCKYQNDFASEGGIIADTTAEVRQATNMIENSAAFTEFARNVGCQIVHCPISLEPKKSGITDKPFGVVERIKSANALTFGAWGAEIVEGMEPVEGDLICPKFGMCAFSSTNLHEQLTDLGIENVIVVGFLTNGSVESTIRTAYEKLYNVFVLPECCAACSMEEHIFSVNQNFPMFATLADGVAMMEALKPRVASLEAGKDSDEKKETKKEDNVPTKKVLPMETVTSAAVSTKDDDKKKDESAASSKNTTTTTATSKE
uniref:Isochorismatase-like domain-containing protein n=1 Tax=Entomoneis paludosa TaxID=265537 RepID=A0A7S2YN98_9STRA